MLSPTTTVIALAAAAFAGGLVRGWTGFGGALIMAPCCAVLINPKDTAEIIILVNVLAGLQGFRRCLPSVHWRKVLPLAAVSIVFTAVFGRLLEGATSTTNRRVIGIAIVVLAVLQLTGWKWRHQGGGIPTFFAGLFGGALTAVAGVPGPPAVLYFGGSARESQTFRANLLSYFVLLYAFSAVVLGFEGRSSRHGFLLSLLISPLYYLGSFSGERLYHRMPGVRFDRIVAIVLAASGITLAIAG